MTTEVELVGRTGETHTVRVSSTTEDPAVPAPWPEPANASGPQAPVLLSDLRELVEERNGTAPQALGALPVAVNGRISKSNETDAYELTVEPETEVDIAVAADTLGSPIDAELELRDAKGARLAINDDTPDGPDPRLTYKVPPGVTKLIAVVRDVNGHAGPRCIYRLSATRKGQENPAGFTLALTEDSHTLEPGLSNVFKVEAVRAGYDGPIDLVFDHLPDSVKISGQNVPAQATATLVTLSSDAPLPPLIIGLKGRGKDGEAAASVESIQLGRFQPWLAQSVALAGAAKSDVAFSVRWGAAVAEKKVPLGGRFVLPVTCTRPPGHDGPVRLTLLTSQGRKTGKVAAQNAALNLREEKAVLIEEDKNAQAAFNVIATAQAALAAAQKAVEANKDDTAAEALAGKVEEAQAAIEKTKAAADEAAQKAKNDVEVAVAVPAELPEIPHQIAFKAELLKRDRRTVEAVAYTPVQEIPVVNPLAVKPHAPAPIQLDPKAGATVEITGKVERLEGAVGDILLTMSDLPPGIAAPPAVTVKAGATDFKFTLKIPPTFKPGEYAGPKIFGTGKPFGPLQVRSRDNPVTLTILSPGKGSGTPVSSDTPKAAGETPVPGGTPHCRAAPLNLDMRPCLLFLCALLPSWPAVAAIPPDLTGNLEATPSSVTLTNLQRPHSVLVRGRTQRGYDVDLTSDATFRSDNEQVAQVDSTGWIQPVANGQATITAQAGDRIATVAVTVQLPSTPVDISFRQDIMPVLSKAGCNAGACHGYSLGKNGFKLSLRGADPEKDYLALTDEFAERRINRNNPDASLLLLKPLGDLPHEGGVRMDRGSVMHEALRRWIAESAKDDPPDLPKLVSVTIHPEKIVSLPKTKQQFQLVAQYSDGSVRDVSRTGIFNVNIERVAKVDDVGLVSVNSLGETAIVARYEGIFAVG
ncbi:Ig domain protein group 2 domain protein [Chthoniobacter flavus Ellin428]|uniref:Ig domain protein group 2 domain protein n=1 Tax=Chthoniobacter flavus Ellin428 TaxID=497964 RepID=B4D659_9BACT|nr:Ig-like domain-containing protein [Chthoniobacter flavus]EDY17968.1 Ig domain protein group 2 domain protein [Chthoniobacter flavus Ellin428]